MPSCSTRFGRVLDTESTAPPTPSYAVVKALQGNNVRTSCLFADCPSYVGKHFVAYDVPVVLLLCFCCLHAGGAHDCRYWSPKKLPLTNRLNPTHQAQLAEDLPGKPFHNLFALHCLCRCRAAQRVRSGILNPRMRGLEQLHSVCKQQGRLRTKRLQCTEKLCP